MRGEEGKRGEGIGVVCQCCPGGWPQALYMTPKRVVLDSKWEQGVVYNMLVFGGGWYVYGLGELDWFHEHLKAQHNNNKATVH